MVNVHKLLKKLEQGMSLFQLNQWKTEGIWYPITDYNRESDEIQVITNLFIPLSKDNTQYYIQLYGNYHDIDEHYQWIEFLEEHQWKIYPLLKKILEVFLPNIGDYQISYKIQAKSNIISIYAKPLNQ